MSRNKIKLTKNNSRFHGEVLSTKFKGSDSYNLCFGIVCRFKYVHNQLENVFENLANFIS